MILDHLNGPGVLTGVLIRGWQVIRGVEGDVMVKRRLE